ncbi:polysaccharide lyase [Mycolicibacterium komossense]|uniref:Heparin lyase I family protein n=1 Tax=Mycolicibacterium komossense TaxID=1779 RepID=A0ABT3CMD5_9MYCO|nr:polysaccharide lyase [Mycolicibacterium komossense]MCV7230649.1 heparin lyase I family protein [Mycolicibacterium komossense]
MIVLTAEQYARMVWKDQVDYAVLRGMRLSDNRYAFPESVLTDPAHARWRRLLARGQIIDASRLTVDWATANDFRIVVSGEQMALDSPAPRPETYEFPMPTLFDIPAPGLFYFECHHNRDRPASDRKNGRRRIEFGQIRDSDVYYVAGNTVWASWATIITDKRAGFDAPGTSIIHQWHQHPGSAIAPPPFAVFLDGGTLNVGTRSPSGGIGHYSVPAPASWAVTRFVTQVTLGQFGHINMWINGEQVVNVDTAVGYYNEGLPYLAYVKSGIYMDNTHTVDALYHANLEFGLADLSSRIEYPLPIPPRPIIGWPRTPDPVVYPGATVYPSHGRFPASEHPVADMFPGAVVYPSLDIYPHI